MKTKEIQQVFVPPPTRWVGNGFKVHNFFPGLLDMQRMSPFFLLDYNAKMAFPPSNIPQGVGVHPHRGIETVTIAYHGKVAHHDSTGNGGIIGEGDLQWMTAGSGILHKEYHEEKFNKDGGDFQMAQIWVNLPKKHKMTSPKYQAIVHKEIPKYQLPNDAGIVEVIAGNYDGIEGVAFTFSPVELYNLRLKNKGEASITLPEDYNTGMLVVKGSVKVNEYDTVPTNNFILFENNGENIRLQAEDDATILTLSGKPLNELIAAGGPFVMNTQEELVQAFQDFEEGKFGRWGDWTDGL